LPKRWSVPKVRPLAAAPSNSPQGGNKTLATRSLAIATNTKPSRFYKTNTMTKETLLQQIAATHSIIEKHTPNNHSLLGGTLGLAMYYYTRHAVWGHKGDADKAVDLVENILLELNSNPNPIMGYNLSSGAAGLGYMLHLLQKAKLVDVDVNTMYADMDAFIYTAALKAITDAHNHDYLHGAMGAVHYFLSRLPNATMEKYITQLLEAFCGKAVPVVLETQSPLQETLLGKTQSPWQETLLGKTQSPLQETLLGKTQSRLQETLLGGNGGKAIPTSTGIWFKNVQLPTDVEDEINLSLAHGQPSFLQILIQASKKKIKVKNIDTLIHTGLQLITSVQQPIDFEKEQYNYFPCTINGTTMQVTKAYSRLAWCYGDLGILSTLYQAAALLPKLWGSTQQLANYYAMGTSTIKRTSLIQTALTDTNFCHGTSGVARCYTYLYQLTGLVVYKEAGNYWLQKTLEQLPTDIEQGIYNGKETDMLDGLVGVNLSLLSYLTPRELQWPKILLV
jgi:lantibiotic modifying enzyme